MMPTDQQEQLSLAVLHAICAKAGFGFTVSGRIQDNWGWDATADVYEQLDPAATLLDFSIKFQLKATRQQLTFANNRYSFPVERAHYERLRRTSGYDVPTYLVVFQMPADQEEWLSCTPEQLVLKRCLRWISLRNAAEVAVDNVTVYLPNAHVLTPDELRRIAKTRAMAQSIDYNPGGEPYAGFL
jgi:hypothetical protein